MHAKSIPALVLLFALAGPAAAQPALDANKLRRSIESGMSFETGDSAPEIFPGETTDVGPQSILKLQRKRRHWEASADNQFFYSSNIGLTESPTVRTDAMVWIGSLQFALAPDPYTLAGRSFAPRVGFRHQRFDYQRRLPGNVNIDFDVQTAFVDARYALAENWVGYAGFDFTRLLGHQAGAERYNEFYKEFTPRYGVERFFPFGERQLLRIGYQGEYHVTDVDAVVPLLTTSRNDRFDQILLVSYTHMFNPHLVVQPFYRFQYSAYTSSGANRNDYLNSIGASAAWVFNSYATLRAFTTYDHKESDNAIVPDYTKFDVGGGLSLTFRF
jgi:hypothetical protein